MITRYAVNDNQLSEWKSICRAYAKKIGAKLIFVDSQSMGIETPTGELKHIYIDELAYLLGMEV